MIVLHFDFKDNQAPLLHAVWDLLGEYESWMTTAPQTADPHQLQLSIQSLFWYSRKILTRKRRFSSTGSCRAKASAVWFGAYKSSSRARQKKSATTFWRLCQ